MKRLIGILGGVASLYAIAQLLFDGFGDSLKSLDVTRFGVAAIAAALLAHAAKHGGGYPWWKHHRSPGFGPGELADVAKHAINTSMTKETSV